MYEMGNVDWKNTPMDEKTRKELLELDSVLGDVLGLEIVVQSYKVEIAAADEYLVGIVKRNMGGCHWWGGICLEDCFENMMKDLKRGVMVGLPRFESASELRMKLELGWML